MLDTYVIYIRYEIINDFIFVSVTMDFWSNYISKSFEFCIHTKEGYLSYFGCCCTNCCHGRGKSINGIVLDSTY